MLNSRIAKKTSEERYDWRKVFAFCPVIVSKHGDKEVQAFLQWIEYRPIHRESVSGIDNDRAEYRLIGARETGGVRTKSSHEFPLGFFIILVVVCAVLGNILSPILGELF